MKKPSTDYVAQKDNRDDEAVWEERPEIGPLPRGRNRILLCVLRENVKTAMRRYGEGKYRPP